jgi:DNA-binding transcriptional LysR family regulator
VEQWFARQHVAPRVVMELENPETVRHLVTAGLGLSICSVSSLGRDRSARSLAILDLEPPLYANSASFGGKTSGSGAPERRDQAILEDLPARHPREQPSRREAAPATPSRERPPPGIRGRV